MAKIWLALFFIFIIYTGLVYQNCDQGNKEREPGLQAMAGWKIWQEKNCQSCHQIYGLGGYMGPDLTNVASFKDEKYLHTYMKYGTGKMPDYKLEDTAIIKLISFLKWVDKSGNTIVPQEKVNRFGTYDLEN
jgi:nitric oxide reductase subunit C